MPRVSGAWHGLPACHRSAATGERPRAGGRYSVSASCFSDRGGSGRDRAVGNPLGVGSSAEPSDRRGEDLNHPEPPRRGLRDGGHGARVEGHTGAHGQRHRRRISRARRRDAPLNGKAVRSRTWPWAGRMLRAAPARSRALSRSARRRCAGSSSRADTRRPTRRHLRHDAALRAIRANESAPAPAATALAAAAASAPRCIASVVIGLCACCSRSKSPRAP